MAPYPPWVALALQSPDWGFRAVWGDIDPGDHRFLSPVGIVNVLTNPGIGTYVPQIELAPRTPGLGFHTLRGGIVRVKDVWNCI